MTISNRVIGNQGCVDRICHKFPARQSPVVLGPLKSEALGSVKGSPPALTISLHVKLLPFALEYECRPVMSSSPAVVILHRNFSRFEHGCESQSFTEHFP